MLVRVSTWAVCSMFIPSFLYILLACATFLEHTTLVKPVLGQLTASVNPLGLREGRAYVCLGTLEGTTWKHKSDVFGTSHDVSQQVIGKFGHVCRSKP